MASIKGLQTETVCDDQSAPVYSACLSDIYLSLAYPLRLGTPLLCERDRRQAELELQNARRKETREMARDLESQLAAVERIAQVGAWIA